MPHVSIRKCLGAGSSQSSQFAALEGWLCTSLSLGDRPHQGNNPNPHKGRSVGNSPGLHYRFSSVSAPLMVRKPKSHLGHAQGICQPLTGMKCYANSHGNSKRAALGKLVQSIVTLGKLTKLIATLVRKACPINNAFRKTCPINSDFGTTCLINSDLGETCPVNGELAWMRASKSG
jgi:hypothetical protein